MMKKFILSLIFIMTIFMITGCSNNKKIVEYTNINNTNNSNESETDSNMKSISNINLTINDKKYNATLENNETAQAFAKLLPQEFNMTELNGNEKYIYMDNSLPTNASKQKQIVAGDIMLYGNNCLVIFYKSFNTSYSYTKIGYIDNLPNLGNGSITISFSK